MPEALLRNVLVTGGAGFIGSHLVEALIPISQRILVLDNLSTGKKSNLLTALQSEKVVFYNFDITDGIALEEIFRENEIEIVFHQAAIANVTQSFQEPLYTNKVNVDATLQLLTLAQKYHVKRVIYASSAAVYGDSINLPLTEDLPLRPTSPYGVSKVACEFYSQVYALNHLVETVGLRYFNVFGPRQNPASNYSGVITLFIRAAKNNKDIHILGDGYQTRDFVFVKDVCQANILAAKTPNISGEIFNIATGQEISINSLAQKIIEKTSSSSRIVYKEPKIGDIYKSFASISKAKKMLGFSPAFDLDKGLTLTI